MIEHRVFKSLNSPVLPLGITDQYLIFLGAVFIFNTFFFYLVSLWLIFFTVLLIIILYFFGRSKIKKDHKYFSILLKSIKRDGFRKKLVYKK